MLFKNYETEIFKANQLITNPSKKHCYHIEQQVSFPNLKTTPKQLWQAKNNQQFRLQMTFKLQYVQSRSRIASDDSSNFKKGMSSKISSPYPSTE